MKKLILYISVLLLVSCEINQKDIKPTDEFVKIYNHPDENLLYYALSVLQLDDGYLILSGAKRQEIFNQYPTATLIRTNNLGETVWTQEYDWKAPAGKLLSIGGKYGFVAMNGSNEGYFVSIDISSGEITETISLDITMPLAARVLSTGELVVLGFDYGSWNSTVSLYNSSLSLSNSESLSVGDDYVSSIEVHMKKTGYEYPFFIGEWNEGDRTGFFVNCLYNYTLGVNFFNADGIGTGGWIIVHQVLYAPSSLLHKDEGSYALTRYYNSKNFVSPTIDVNVDGVQNFNDSIQNPMYELPPNAKIQANNISFDGVEYMTFTSVTNFNAIIISQYAMDNSEPIHSEYINFTDQTEVVDVIQDKIDEGIIVLARTHITGRYIRPMLLKIPKRSFIPK